MARRRLSALVAAAALVAACGRDAPNPFRRGADAADRAMPASPLAAAEAPDVFSVTEAALWDGRPSLGGIWVAHPDVGDPERVAIRVPATGRSTSGALFRRERAAPGPRLQISSEAAEALGVVAGQPVLLEVVALARTVAAAEPAAAPGPAAPPGSPATAGPAP